MMNILFVTSEAYPLVKTGGLADVAGALPAALARLGEDVRLLIPGYSEVLDKAEVPKGAREMRLGPLLGPRDVRLLERRMPDSGIGVWVVDCPPLYQRAGGPYVGADGWDHGDNFMRFAVLSRAAALISQGGAFDGWRPDVLHAHDWQTGLAPAYLALWDGPRPATVFTIHNMHFQGIFGHDVLQMVGLPPQAWSVEGVEFYGHMSYLKAGLFYADHLTTVSPTYAHEIQMPEGGRGLDGLLRGRHAQLTGILNGIDTDLWNPARDPLLPATYSPDSLLAKTTNRGALRARFGLADDPDRPVVGLVGRLTEQKGADLLGWAVEAVQAARVQVVVLGSGDPAIEGTLRGLAAAMPDTFAVTVGYDEALSHLVQAGSDFFLVPSRFEPCGLTQMYALRYGTPPIVRRTGGLADTVVDVNANPATGNGFVFDAATGLALGDALVRAAALWRTPEAYVALQKRGMAQDFSWTTAAGHYQALYADVVARQQKPD